jgi:hypothetical protein
MTTYCPQCGQSSHEESAVLPLVAMWSRCEQCQFVWRSSVLDTVATYAKRRVGLARYEKVEGRSSPSVLMDTSALSKPVTLDPVDTDRVAQWLVSQEKGTTGPRLAPAIRVAHDHRDPAAVEEFFDLLDPVTAPVRTESQKDFYSFFNEKPAAEDALTEEWLNEEEATETAVAAEARESTETTQWTEWIEACETTEACEALVPLAEEPVSPVAESRSVDTPLDTSFDRALTNIEDLYDAFKRLEQQLGGMDKMCEELTQ